MFYVEVNLILNSHREYARAVCPYKDTQALTLWPPSRGYALVFWFLWNGSSKSKIIRYLKCLVDLRSLVLTASRSLQSPQSSAKISVAIADGKLVLKTLRHFNVQFNDVSFEPNRWYHVVLSHSASSSPTSTRASLFVNGARVQTLPLLYPAGEPSPLTLVFGPTTPIKSLSAQAALEKRS